MNGQHIDDARPDGITPRTDAFGIAGEAGAAYSGEPPLEITDSPPALHPGVLFAVIALGGAAIAGVRFMESVEPCAVASMTTAAIDAIRSIITA